MLFRKLGNTGYDVSIIGFGTWQLGGKRWAALPEGEAVELLQKSREAGVNIYDVAVVYGQYRDERGFLQSRSQELLGLAFAKRRDEVIYCLKLGQFDEYSHLSDYSPHRIIEQFQQSLKRLKTDYVDICLVHAPSLHDIQDGRAITILQTLQALGLVRAVGYSVENEPEHVKTAIRQKIDVVLLQYNLIDQECGFAIEEARQRGIAILIGGVFKRGYLTGNYDCLADLPMADDYWHWNVRLNRDKVEGLLRQTQALKARFKSPEGLRRAALQLSLQQAGVASCIVGHRAMAEVLENIAFSTGTIYPFSEALAAPDSEKKITDVL